MTTTYDITCRLASGEPIVTVVICELLNVDDSLAERERILTALECGGLSHLGIEASAVILGVTIGRIRALIRDGRFRAVRMSTAHVLVPIDDVRAYLHSPRRPGQPRKA